MRWHIFLYSLAALTVDTVAFAATPVTEATLRGTWKEKSGDKVYVFGNKHEFEYRFLNNRYVNNVKQEWVEREAGAWEFGPEICALGNIKGNLFTHVGTQRCCHTAYFLGSNLVLTSVAPPRFEGACSDRVLVREPSEAQTKQ